MEEDIWKRCPSTTNAVERRNRECKSDTPQCLKLAMIKVYKVDKVACLKHIAAEEGTVLSYRSRTEESRRMEALAKQKQRMKYVPDKTSQYGPPDHADNFSPAQPSRKRKDEAIHAEDHPKRLALCVDNKVVKCIPNLHPEIVGKRARMKFEVEDGKESWFEGVVSSYNVLSGKYAVYFPSDGVTEEVSFSDEDFEVMD